MRDKHFTMSDGEICRSYSEAKNKGAQIGILADLNLCSKKSIRDILCENGLIAEPKPPSFVKSGRETAVGKDEEVPIRRINERAAPVDWSVMDREVSKLAAEGLKATQIAERLGISAQAIYDRKRKYKKEAENIMNESKPKPAKKEILEVTAGVPKEADYSVLGKVVKLLTDAGFPIVYATYDFKEGNFSLMAEVKQNDTDAS